MKTKPNNDYYYENTEMDLLAKHPEFQPIDSHTKWAVSCGADTLNSNAGDQIRNLQDGETLLMPFSDKNHINGVVIKRTNGKLSVSWLDSYESYYLPERQTAFLSSLNKIVGSTGVSIEPIQNIPVEQQGKEPASCGPRTMNNLQRLAHNNIPAKTQDQSILRQSHIDILGSENFAIYQSFPSDIAIRSKPNSATILAEKEEIKLGFIMEALEFVPPERKLVSPTRENPQNIDGNDINAPTKELAKEIYKQASPELKEALKSFVAVAPALTNKDQKAQWQEMKRYFTELNPKDGNIFTKMEQQGFDYRNVDSLDIVNKHVEEKVKAARERFEATSIHTPTNYTGSNFLIRTGKNSGNVRQ